MGSPSDDQLVPNESLLTSDLVSADDVREQVSALSFCELVREQVSAGSASKSEDVSEHVPVLGAAEEDCELAVSQTFGMLVVTIGS
jgi:hypothetical protein